MGWEYWIELDWGAGPSGVAWLVAFRRVGWDVSVGFGFRFPLGANHSCIGRDTHIHTYTYTYTTRLWTHSHWISGTHDQLIDRINQSIHHTIFTSINSAQGVFELVYILINPTPLPPTYFSYPFSLRSIHDETRIGSHPSHPIPSLPCPNQPEPEIPHSAL